MTFKPYNKSAPRQGSSVHGQVIAPDRGAACTDMKWEERFSYDAATGTLTWLPKPPSEKDAKRWNGRYAGNEAGHIRNMRGQKRKYICFADESQKHGCSIVAVHTIIWEMHHGKIPNNMVIDHVNGDTLNNRIENLRIATKSQNSFNAKPRKNTAGVKGVSKSGKLWVARIMINGRSINLGTHQTKGLAAVARAKAALRYHGAFARIV